MDKRTVDYYDTHAPQIAGNYESVESPFASLFPVIFKKGDRVLDIGCGSGRDMALLLRLECDPYGLEASASLIDFAHKKHPELRGRIEHGAIPGGVPEEHHGSFDGVVLSAVLMHIPDSELFDAAFEVRRLTKTGGTLLVSFSVERDDMTAGQDRGRDNVAAVQGESRDLTTAGRDQGRDDVAAGQNQDRDTKGRLMVVRPAARVQLLFERIGFETVATWHSADKAGRTGISWTSLQFVYRGSAGSQSINRIESIINRDTKVATYKLALLRAFCDISQHEAGIVRWARSGEVAIPIQAIADKWIEYYWPLIEYDQFIPQKNGEYPGTAKPITFRKRLQELTDYYERNGGLSGYKAEHDAHSISRGSSPLYGAALSATKRAVQQPVRYAGGGDSPDKPFYYDASSRSVLMDGQLWREFSLLGYLIHDSIVLRWAEETNRMSKGEIDKSAALGLLLSSVTTERDVAVAREVYGGLDALRCVWTDASLRKFDVDHAIPFSLWRDNSLWNLLPASPQVNNAKRDKLPGIDLIEKRKDSLIYHWEIMKGSHDARFRRDASKIISAGELDWRNWKETLFSGFLEAVETTAVKRGAERWAP